MDGHSTFNASQRKASGFVLLVLEYGDAAMLQDHEGKKRKVHQLKGHRELKKFLKQLAKKSEFMIR